MPITQRFPLQPYGNDFATGRCANGDQVIMGLLCPDVVLYRFNEDGKLLGCEFRAWSHPAEHRNGVYVIYDPVFEERLANQIEAWQTEMGFTSQTIFVEQFYDDERSVGIELPDTKSCAFIFWWAKDYWMNDAGEVEST